VVSPQAAAGRPVMERQRRDGVHGRHVPRPDEQHLARSMIDHETGRAPEALGSGPGGTVPGQDQQIRPRRRRQDLTFDTPVTLGPHAGTAQAARRLEQFMRGRGSELGQPRARVAFGMAAAEQAGLGAVSCARDLLGGDMHQHERRFSGGECAGCVHTARPGPFGHPDDHGHVRRGYLGLEFSLR
jgi:hypothetical protein